MIKLLKNFIKNFNIKNKSTLLSISGGIDSIVMAEIFNEAKLKFSIAHCNFGLRGIESKKDEIFVEKIAKKYKVKFYKKKFDTIKHSKQNNISIQMSARNLRYDWLNYISKKNGFSKIATAHHINDSIETFIINIIKGSGISGFHGILYKNKKIIRPIICLNKKMIIEYAKKKKLKWREDLSNKKNKYQRNIVRNKVIPILKNINPSFEKNIKNTIEKISQTEKIFYKYIKKIKNEVFYFKKSNYYINIEKVKKEHYEYIYILILEIIKKFQFNYSQIKKIIKIEKNGKIIESKKWKVLIDKKLWVLNKNKNKNKNKIILNYNIRNINNIKINIKKKIKIKKKENIHYLDIKFLKFPLIIRKWKNGDFFYPIGMNKKKKISNFFIDKKIQINVKKKTNIILSKKKIICIIDYRIDNRFKITNYTKYIYIINIYK